MKNLAHPIHVVYTMVCCSLIFCLLSAQSDAPDIEERDHFEEICSRAVELGCNFKAWKEEYNIKYETVEDDRKHHLQFCQNCALIMGHQGSFSMKLSRNAAMSFQEIQKHRGLSNKREKKKKEQKVQKKRLLTSTTLPSSLDYSNYNGVNCIGAVGNEGNCNSDWAFASTSLYESILCINGHNYALSQEAILQCTHYESTSTYHDNDCYRGYMYDALIYLSKWGGVKASDYPYVAGGYGKVSGYPLIRGICSDQNRIYLGPANATEHYPTTLTVDQLKTLLVNNGPVLVGVDVTTSFEFYSSGVYDHCPPYSYYYLNHAVLLYGWDSNGNWLIKNSWGPDWGINGTMILSSRFDCGIRYDVVSLEVPTVNTNVEVTMNMTYG